MRKEMQRLVDHPIERDRVVEDDHGCRTKVSAQGAYGRIIHGRIQDLLVHHNEGGGGAGRHDGSNGASVLYAAAVVVDQLAERGSERQFVVAWLPHAAGKREHLYARAVRSAQSLVPIRTVGDD